MDCEVKQLERTETGWNGHVRHGDFSNGHPFHPEREVTDERFVESFDHVVVASGRHNIPKTPETDGLGGITRRQVHSSDCRKAADFAGQRGVVVGAAESGCDIARQLAEVGETTAAQQVNR